jgi:putative protease
MVEIMAPVGSWESLRAALNAGADSIYFGVDKLHMRAHATTFKLTELPKIVSICKEKNVKTYLTLNVVVYDQDMQVMKQICDAAKKAEITAIIVSDVAVMQYAKSIDLEVHSSTQLNISNIEAVKFYSQYTDVVVLARELSLDQIKKICAQIKEQDVRGPKGELVEVEIFVHGALCVSVSGKCYMSLAQYNSSANRGACLQNCRRAYRVTDEETGEELKIDNKYVMSPKDLCTIGFVDQIIEAGVSVFKIEGRARPPEYVDVVVRAYKEAVKSVEERTYTPEKVKEWLKQLETVYNRGFWQGGYYLGKKLGEWTGAPGSRATKKKSHIGKVLHYFSKQKVAHVIIESGSLKKGDELLITGTTTGLVKLKVEELWKDAPVESATKGEEVTFKVPELVRAKDKVYLFEDRKKISLK